MPIQFERDEARQRLLATVTGTVSADEVVQFISTQDAIGAWHYRLLVDARQSDSADFRSKAAQAMIDHVRHVARGRMRGPVAVVADPDTVAEIARFYVTVCGQTSGLVIGVFQDVEGAEEWLERMPVAPAVR